MEDVAAWVEAIDPLVVEVETAAAHKEAETEATLSKVAAEEDLTEF